MNTPVHVLVVVPKIDLKRPAEDEPIILKKLKPMELKLSAMESKTLTDFKILSVCEDEFRLGNLSTIQESGSPIVKTPTLHAFGRNLANSPLTFSFGWKKWCSGKWLKSCCSANALL
eukprot:jgi/Phyca11/577434/estExt2_Genewise1.C_PHYCAscaffold_1160013